MFRLLLLTTILGCVLAATIPRGPVPIPDGRIIGGEETTIDKHPYQLSIRHLGTHRCGASIYKSNVGLTAAHCVDGTSLLLLRFVAGSSLRNSGGESQYPAKVIVHEGYSPITAQNDIALVIFKEHYVFSDTIQPIKLPEYSPAVGSNAVVSGWGTEDEGASTIPVQLRATTVQIVDFEDCVGAYKATPYDVLPGMLCAGAPEGGKDACQGDSGGPLNIGLTQVGIVSWGQGCARKGFPGINTDVAQYVSWIKSKA